MLEFFSAAVALVLALLLMPGFIRYMHQKGMIQPKYDLGPDSFKRKEKPPNMGGVVISIATFFAALLTSQIYGDLLMLAYLLFPSMGALAIGLADDYIKDVHQHHEGLKPRFKLIGQAVVGFLFAIFVSQVVGTAIHLPFTKTTLDLGWFYIPLMTLVFIFMTNSANLQDGVDGLMGSVSAVGAAAFGAIAIIIRGGSLGHSEIAYVCFALNGACLGFLFFNQHPAKIYMGDTGSMFIGGLLTGVAMLLRLPLWLLLLCITMVVSSLSVIIQRIYFKATGGKRLFKMSPIHHHFEKLGWSENTIVRRYTIFVVFFSLIAALAALPIAL